MLRDLKIRYIHFLDQNVILFGKEIKAILLSVRNIPVFIYKVTENALTLTSRSTGSMK